MARSESKQSKKPILTKLYTKKNQRYPSLDIQTTKRTATQPRENLDYVVVVIESSAVMVYDIVELRVSGVDGAVGRRTAGSLGLKTVR